MRRILFFLAFGLTSFFICPQRAEPQDNRTDKFGDPLPKGAIARIGTTRYRVGMNTGFMPLLSPDGSQVVTSVDGVTFDLWQLPAWKKLSANLARGMEEKGPHAFQSLAWSSDGKQLAAHDADQHRFYLFEPTTGKLLKKINSPEKNQQRDQETMLLSRDGHSVVLSVPFADGNQWALLYVVWDLAKDTVREAIRIARPNDSRSAPFALSPDGRRLVHAGSEQNGNGVLFTLEFFDLTNDKSLRKIETDRPMQMLAFAPDGKTLAACDRQSVLRIYEAATGKEMHNIRLKRGLYHRLQFAPDGAALYLADNATGVQRFDPARGERTEVFKAPVAAVASQLGFAPDGKVLALGYDMVAALHLWEVTTGKVLSPVGVPTAPIVNVGFSPKGELFVSPQGGTLSWWNPRTAVKIRDLHGEFDAAAIQLHNGIEFQSLIDPDVYGRGRAPSNCLLSRTGAFVIDFGLAGLGFFDAKTGKRLYDEAYGNSQAIAIFDRDQKIAAVQGKKLRIWNTRSGRDHAQIELPLGEEIVINLEATSTGKQFAFLTANNNTGLQRFLLWDTERKQLARERPMQSSVPAMEFSPDDRWLALADIDGQTRLLRLGQPLADRVFDFGGVSQLSFSADGRQLACAAGRISIVETASGKVRLELPGHTNGMVRTLAFAHDGGLLASGNTDTTVLIWNAGLRAFANQPADKPAGADELAARFDKLADADAQAAFQAMIQLARTPTQTIQLFEQKIAPAKKLDTGVKTIPQWINDLGNPQFALRTKAAAMLTKLGPTAETHLRAALPNAKDVEMKRRIEALLEQIASQEWSADDLRHARAVEIVEAFASPAAHALLTRWAAGEPSAVLSLEATRALGRLRVIP